MYQTKKKIDPTSISLQNEEYYFHNVNGILSDRRQYYINNVIRMGEKCRTYYTKNVESIRN